MSPPRENNRRERTHRSEHGSDAGSKSGRGKHPTAFDSPPRPAPWAALLLELIALVLVAGLPIGCRGSLEIYESETEDVFIQDPLRQVDILLVVDNSGSMIEEQEKLASQFESFIAAFESAQVDYHIGVITTDVQNQAQAGILQGEVAYITPDTPNAAEVFSENVRVGTKGSGFEMGLEAARLALTEPRVSNENAGFLRATASLAIIAFSDEDDLSPEAVDDYLNLFASLKGAASLRDKNLMNISAVAGDVPYGCEAADGSGEASAGERYRAAVDRTGGVFSSICSEDFQPIVEALGLDISGLRDRFTLTRCARPETLEVTAGGRVHTLGATYDYLPTERAIEFRPDWIPQPNEEIHVRYSYYPGDLSTCPEEDAL